MKIVRNSESWIPLDQLGQSIPPYRRTFVDGDSFYINAFHAGFATCPLQNEVIIDFGIPGWQRREDALKLYELAYYVKGDILELGCFQGLSTTIMARALEDAGKQAIITSVDNKLRHLLLTRRILKRRGLRRYVRLMLGDATKASGRLVRSRRTFGFAFVDAGHSYDSVLGVCRILSKLMSNGGFCLFHDYNDLRNLDPDFPDYGVPQAVQDGLPNETFEFHGIFGCCALYRRK